MKVKRQDEKTAPKKSQKFLPGSLESGKEGDKSRADETRKKKNGYGQRKQSTAKVAKGKAGSIELKKKKKT